MKTKLAFCNAHVNYEYIADVDTFASYDGYISVTLLDATHQRACVLRKTHYPRIVNNYYYHYVERYHYPPTSRISVFCVIPKEYVRF